MAPKHEPTLAADLRRLLRPERVADDDALLLTHAADRWFASRTPEVIVLASSTEDGLSHRLFRACRRQQHPRQHYSSRLQTGSGRTRKGPWGSGRMVYPGSRLGWRHHRETRHGIAKQRWWPQAVSEVGHSVHESLKLALDPQGLLNPDKFVTIHGAR